MKQDILAEDELKAWVCFGLLFPSSAGAWVTQVALSLLPPLSTTQAGNINNNHPLQEWQLDPERGSGALGTP